MKKQFKTIMFIGIGLIIGLIIAIFAVSNAHLGKLTNENIVFDVTEKFDINDYLTKVKNGTEVTYDLDEEISLLTVNLKKGKKEETLSTNVTIVYPRVTVEEGVVVDKYVGYNLDDYINVEDGVKYTYDFDEETGVLTVNYSKGEYSNSVSTVVTVTSSDPKDNVRNYDCINISGMKYQMVVYPDGTLEEIETSTGNVYTGYYDMKDENNGEMHHMINAPSNWRFKIYFSDDSSEASFFIGNGSGRDACELTGINAFDGTKIIKSKGLWWFE